MPILRPFRALHYDPAAVGDLSAVIAPPYDVIDEGELGRLYARSPHNVVRLILNREADRYGAAAEELATWRSRGVLVRDPEPCLYYYAQDFTLPGGRRLQRRGLIAAVRLERFGEGHIRPHERTFARAKEDRLRLTAACRANLSPIFGIYPNRPAALDPARALSEREAAWIEAGDERGGRHRVWRVADAAAIESMRTALADAAVLIADGHHRYETALAYRDMRRAEGDTDPEAPHNFVMMYLDSMADPGLVILPTHRVWCPRGGRAEIPWAELERVFEIDELPPDTAGEAELLARLGRVSGVGCFGLRVARPDRCCLLRLRDGRLADEALGEMDPSVRSLDTTVLDVLVLRQILGLDGARAVEEGSLVYTHDDGEALAAPRRGAAASFLLRTPRMSELQAVCEAGELMPEKSTYFYPKLQTGLVFHTLDRDG